MSFKVNWLFEFYLFNIAFTVSVIRILKSNFIKAMQKELGNGGSLKNNSNLLTIFGKSHQRCSMQKMYFKISHDLLKNSCEFCKIFKGVSFREHLRTTVSAFYRNDFDSLICNFDNGKDFTIWWKEIQKNHEVNK